MGAAAACGAITTTCPPEGGIVNGVVYVPVLGTPAVALTAFGNVPMAHTADLIEVLFGQAASAGFVDQTNTRLAKRLTKGGSAQAMRAALPAEPVLTADESRQGVRPALRTAGLWAPRADRGPSHPFYRRGVGISGRNEIRNYGRAGMT